jgi:DnaK suppressor protein
MRPRDLEKFRTRLLSERAMLIARASRTLENDATYDPSDLPDEIDQATAEYGHSLEFRLRDREAYYLAKIDKALRRIEEGEFGTCELCEEPIATRRLEARPVTTLCVRCKEEQEMDERSYGE